MVQCKWASQGMSNQSVKVLNLYLNIRIMRLTVNGFKTSGDLWPFGKEERKHKNTHFKSTSALVWTSVELKTC